MRFADSFSPITPSAKYTDPGVMLAFYQRLFPFRFLFQWLNHSIKPSNDFAYREFAFMLQNDAYLRYQSFKTGDLYVLGLRLTVTHADVV